MSLVLDSSVALSWCFSDEHTPSSLAVLDQVSDAGAIAPQLWPLEVLNGLVIAERRARIGASSPDRMGSLLRDLPVTLDVESAQQAWGHVL
jgi:predicted nucleic acid-binding protein